MLHYKALSALCANILCIGYILNILCTIHILFILKVVVYMSCVSKWWWCVCEAVSCLWMCSKIEKGWQNCHLKNYFEYVIECCICYLKVVQSITLVVIFIIQLNNYVNTAHSLFLLVYVAYGK